MKSISKKGADFNKFFFVDLKNSIIFHNKIQWIELKDFTLTDRGFISSAIAEYKAPKIMICMVRNYVQGLGFTMSNYSFLCLSC